MNTSHIVSFASLGDICMDIYDLEKKTFPGGTALNVAVSARRARADVSIVSTIGDDEHGKDVQRVCQTLGINTTHVRVVNKPTSSIHIQKDPAGKFPVFDGWDVGALEEFTLTPEIVSFLATQDIARAVLFKQIEKSFAQFCSLPLPNTYKAADFAGESLYSENTESIRSYISGLDVIIKSLESDDTKSFAFLENSAQRFPEKLFIVLLGEKGSMVLRGGEKFIQPAVATRVVDTNGAGDAYVGVFLVIYTQTHDIHRAMRKAAEAASRVISHLGAIELNV